MVKTILKINLPKSKIVETHRKLIFHPLGECGDQGGPGLKTSQELRMLSSVTINCQETKIVMNSGSQLSEL